MIAVDTNVLLRLLVSDHEEQTEQARRLFDDARGNEPVYVGLIVLVEMVWALRSRYGYDGERIDAVVDGLLRTADIHVEAATEVSSILADEAQGTRVLADALIALAARQAGCTTTYTFDRRAARDVPGMTLLT